MWMDGRRKGKWREEDLELMGGSDAQTDVSHGMDRHFLGDTLLFRFSSAPYSRAMSEEEGTKKKKRSRVTHPPPPLSIEDLQADTRTRALEMSQALWRLHQTGEPLMTPKDKNELTSLSSKFAGLADRLTVTDADVRWGFGKGLSPHAQSVKMLKQKASVSLGRVEALIGHVRRSRMYSYIGTRAWPAFSTLLHCAEKLSISSVCPGDKWISSEYRMLSSGDMRTLHDAAAIMAKLRRRLSLHPEERAANMFDPACDPLPEIADCEDEAADDEEEARQPPSSSSSKRRRTLIQGVEQDVADTAENWGAAAAIPNRLSATEEEEEGRHEKA